MINHLKNNPTIVTGLVAALIALGVSFGLSLSTEQTGTIMAVVSAVLAAVNWVSVTPARLVAAKDDGGVLVAGPAAGSADGTEVVVRPVSMP